MRLGERRDPLVVMSVIVVIAILARVGAQLLLGFYRSPETWEEGVIAADLAAGRGYGFEMFGTWQQAFRGPLYPLILGALYFVLGTGPLVAGALNVVLGAATAAAGTFTGWRVSGRRTGALSGLLVAGHPGLLVYSAKIHQLSLDALLIALAVLAVALAIRRPALPLAIALGTLGGLLALSRPTALSFVALGAILIPVASRTRAALRWSALVILLSAAVSGIWIVRNQVVVGAATLSTSTGLFVWTGNNPHAIGGATSADGRAVFLLDPELLERVNGRDEVEQDRIFMEAALTYIRDDPLRTVRHVWSRHVFFWWFGPNAGANYPPAWLPLYASFYLVIVSFASVGAAALWRQRRRLEVMTLVGAPALVGLSQALFYVEGRHRWAVEGVLLVLSAAGIVALADALRRGRPRPYGSVPASLSLR